MPWILPPNPSIPFNGNSQFRVKVSGSQFPIDGNLCIPRFSCVFTEPCRVGYLPQIGGRTCLALHPGNRTPERMSGSGFACPSRAVW